MANNDPIGKNLEAVLTETETKIEKKNIFDDGIENYLLKNLIERQAESLLHGESVPLIYKIAAVVYIPLHYLRRVSIFSSTRRFNQEYLPAWQGVLDNDISLVTELIMEHQRGHKIIRAMAKDELSDSGSRKRIIVLAILIALIMLGLPLLLSSLQ